MNSGTRSDTRKLTKGQIEDALVIGLDGLFRTLGIVKPNEYFQIKLPGKGDTFPLDIKITKELEVSRTTTDVKT